MCVDEYWYREKIANDGSHIQEFWIETLFGEEARIKVSKQDILRGKYRNYC